MIPTREQVEAMGGAAFQLRTMLITKVLAEMAAIYRPDGGCVDVEGAWKRAIEAERAAGTEARLILMDVLCIQFLGDTAPGDPPWKRPGAPVDEAELAAMMADPQFLESLKKWL